MSTAIILPENLLRRVEARAAVQGREASDLLVDYVERGLGEATEAEIRELRRRTPLPIIPAASTGTVIPALTPDELARIEEEDDLAGFTRSAGR